MPIPPNITHQNVLQAINKVNIQGTPPRRGPRHWAVLYNGIHYPCKLLISWAHEFAYGDELEYNSFISDQARPYLTERGFNVVPY